ncbi:hypothetical protein [Enhygromyxa salina]|uniref:Uncharacterized protein n=1 Tax=Enhygromyxa salina TaxID=215803 RepID=A0A2S9YNF0_9BACT|nr:hypothetical protein [Enhygromyxa salina]PRQ06620.1 hypothetical protein ENSA7_36790 [Enhygromyxa salina]
MFQVAFTIFAALPSVTISNPGSVEVIQTADSAQLVILDADGLQSGSVVLWVEPEGSLVMVFDYPDGWAQATITDAVTFDPDSTLTPAQIALRLQAVETALGHAVLDYGTHPQKGPLPCAFGIVSTAILLARANPFGLAAGYNAACTCIPHLSKEFKDIKCPG